MFLQGSSFGNARASKNLSENQLGSGFILCSKSVNVNLSKMMRCEFYSVITHDYRKLSGCTVFVTGASRGIGKAIALKAARDGANVVIAAKTADKHPKLPGTIYTAAEESKNLYIQLMWNLSKQFNKK